MAILGDIGHALGSIPGKFEQALNIGSQFQSAGTAATPAAVHSGITTPAPQAPKPVAAPAASPNDAAFNAYMKQQQGLTSQTQALLQQQNALLKEQATPAPVLNYGAILANAQAQANKPNSAVNKLYTQQLNNYLQNAAAQQKLAQQQQQLSVTQAQQGLQNTQAQLGQQQQYTGQQTEMDLGNIANQQKFYEQQQGMQGEQNLNALRAQNGQAGLAGSGLGAQSEFTQNLGRQIQENQQTNQFQYQRNTDLLSEQNTFAQIAQSGKYAKQTEAGQEGQANIDLSKFLQQAAYAKNQSQQSLQQWRTQAETAAAQNAAAQQVSRFIQSYKSNPLLYSKAMQAYSGLTQGGSQPELPGLQTVNA